jgi:hypothetical protein
MIGIVIVSAASVGDIVGYGIDIAVDVNEIGKVLIIRVVISIGNLLLRLLIIRRKMVMVVVERGLLDGRSNGLNIIDGVNGSIGGGFVVVVVFNGMGRRVCMGGADFLHPSASCSS